MDPGNVSAPWMVSYQGFNTFDVTTLVKAAMAGSVPGHISLQMSGTPSKGDGASFTFSSKEKNTGQSRLLRSAYLLITLQDAWSITTRIEASKAIDESKPGTSLSDVASLPIGSQASQRKAALLKTTGASALALGFEGISQSVATVRVSQPVGSATTSGPSKLFLDWLKHPAVTENQSQATWSSVNAYLPAQTSASSVLDKDARADNQIAVIDLTGNSMPEFANPLLPDMWLALSSNLQQPTHVDGGQTSGAPYPPRGIVAVSPLPDNDEPMIHRGDPNVPLEFSVVFDNRSMPAYTRGEIINAHVGQPIPAFHPRVKLVDSDLGLFLPLNWRLLPDPNGASASFQSLDFELDDYRRIAGTANEHLGQYSLVGTAAGHNVPPLTMHFQNLPLPTPTLTGPKIVAMPTGATSVSVPADAAQPFELSVDDSGNTRLIDDTNQWVISSSSPSDVVPRTIYSAHGSTRFALTFGSLGMRTITVVSKGAPEKRETLEVNVLKAQSIDLKTPGELSFAVGSFEIEADASSALPVSVASTTEKVCTIEARTVTIQAAGLCTLEARQAGDASTYAPAETVTQSIPITKAIQEIAFEAQSATSRLFTPGAVFGIEPLAMNATPSSGLPITYSTATPDICMVSGTQVTMLSVGACVMVANQAGNMNYEAAVQKSQSVTLNARKSFSGMTVPPATGVPGRATASMTGGGDACRFDPEGTAFVAASAPPPPGKSLPQGLFKFKLVDCTPEPIAMTIEWPQEFTGYTKYGRETKEARASSYFLPTDLRINGGVATFTVQDGHKGDDDWQVNGNIVDPSGPVADAKSVTPVPTLAPWPLMLLGLLTAALGWAQGRRRL